MLGTVTGTVLGTGVESKTETPRPLEALKGHGREMIGWHENTQEGERGVTAIYWAFPVGQLLVGILCTLIVPSIL